jgi:hypothetical protein
VLLLPVALYGAVGAWAHGSALRRDHAEMRLERGERREREQQPRAEVAALAKRGRIDRDLHTLVTHGVAAIVVQTEAADAVLDADPLRSRCATSPRGDAP